MKSQLLRSYNIEKQNLLLNAVLGSLALAISAQIALPWGPVPFTLQTSILFFLAFKFGFASTLCMVSAYLLEGACELPVFAEFTGGLPILFGPTGGYLWGFIPALFCFDKFVTQEKRSFGTISIAIVLSSTLIFLLGFLQLSSFIGFSEAYRWGVCPFLFSETGKIAVVSYICALSSKYNG